MMIRPVHKLYAPIDRITPALPPHSFAEEYDFTSTVAKRPPVSLPAATPHVKQTAPAPHAGETYSSRGLKISPPQPKGVLLDKRV